MEGTYTAAARLAAEIHQGKVSHESAITALRALRGQWTSELHEAEARGDAQEILTAWRQVGHAGLILSDFEAFQRAGTKGLIEDSAFFEAMGAIANESVILRWLREAHVDERASLLRRLARTYGMPLPRLPDA
jgi:hypothetical protein